LNVLRGTKSLGSARYWQPVLSIYIRPLTISRMTTGRLFSSRLAGGTSDSISADSASVRPLMYRSRLRS